MLTWFIANKMALNVSKIKYIIFHNKGKRVDMQNLSVCIHDNTDLLNPDPSKIHTLDRVFSSNQNQCDRSFKLLSVHLHENLNLNAYLSILLNKLSQALNILRQVKNFLPLAALKTLYYSLFNCHITYCPIILSMTSQSNITRIAKLPTWNSSLR